MRRVPNLLPPRLREAPLRQRVLAVGPALTAVLCTAAVALGLVLFARPPAAAVLAQRLPGTPVAPAWPTAGQAAFAVDGGGHLASPDQSPVPVASTAKLMTAYVFLARHPLEPGRSGPSYTVSAAEAARYGDRSAASQSLVPLRAGQRLTERQALQALLAASANNVADELARWYGPDPGGFVAAMNRTAHDLGMERTHYTGPSGLEATTVSTAADQVRLLRAALRLPDFAALAGTSYTDVLGHRHANTNPMLGHDGVFAGKTGTTRQAGRNLVFAARREIDGHPRIVVGAVLGQPSPATLTGTARQLITDSDRSLATTAVVRAGEVLAHVRDGWGRSVALHAAHDLKVAASPGSLVTLAVDPGDPLAGGAPAGVTAGRVALTGLHPAGGAPAGRTDGAAGAAAGTPSVALVTAQRLPAAPAPVRVLMSPWAGVSWVLRALGG
ncbi:serine hydrolase [Streptomyces sp. NPDC089919]|uniref:D-alanyl-D-alanine carboxypeptidase family protein n=1 Tax=Streptomyces sp. NPDC089919 TaxID=3155188 RepID=UPI003442558E